MILTFAKFDMLFKKGSDHFEKLDNSFGSKVLQRAANDAGIIFDKNFVEEWLVLSSEGLFKDDLIWAFRFGIFDKGVVGLDELVQLLNVSGFADVNCGSQIALGGLYLLINQEVPRI